MGVLKHIKGRPAGLPLIGLLSDNYTYYWLVQAHRKAQATRFSRLRHKTASHLDPFSWHRDKYWGTYWALSTLRRFRACCNAARRRMRRSRETEWKWRWPYEKTAAKSPMKAPPWCVHPSHAGIVWPGVFGSMVNQLLHKETVSVRLGPGCPRINSIISLSWKLCKPRVCTVGVAILQTGGRTELPLLLKYRPK